MYRFKRAETDAELEQVFRLNHATFAEELGQHSRHDDGRLVDRFHDRNVYYVALEGDAVVGMIAVHDDPPWSVAGKLADASVLDTLGRLLEVRLLAVEPAHRNQTVAGGLFWEVHRHGLQGYDTLVISGVVDQERLYTKLGFHALGPPAPSGAAWFVPMAMKVGALPERRRWSAERWERRRAAREGES